VVNEAMARRFFPNSDPIGHAQSLGANGRGPVDHDRRVAGDVRHFGLADADQPAIYTPFVQAAQDWKRWSEIVVRGPGRRRRPRERRAPAAASPSIPTLPITASAPWTASSPESLARQRFGAELLSIFAGSALGLSCVGIFGVMWAACVGAARRSACAWRSAPRRAASSATCSGTVSG
jgi:hypothetical protein